VGKRFLFRRAYGKIDAKKTTFLHPEKKAVLPVGAHSRAADMPEETI